MAEDGFRERMLMLLDGLAGKTAYYVARMPAPAWVREVRDLTVVNSNIPSDTFNCVISRGLDEERGVAAMEEVCSTFNAAGLPAAWWTCDGIRGDFMARELESRSFVEDETDVAMMAELGAVPRGMPSSGLDVRLVSSSDSVREFGHVLSQLATPPDSQTFAYYTAVSKLRRVEGSPMSLFLGFADGRAVCTASLFVDGETGHIFDVSTLAECRGRGFAAAMMCGVLDHARGVGARRAGLQASSDGLRLYRRLGFEEVGMFRVYSNRRHVANSRQN